MSPGLAIAPPSGLRDGVLQARARSIARRAAHSLPDARPHLSYRDVASFPQIAAVAVLAGPLASLATLSFEPLWVSLMTIAGLAFLAMTRLRLSTALNPVPIEPRRRPRRWRSQDLPIYTVIVPLYREGRVLPRLLAALSALDYPRSKLQAMLVVEAEDETRAALARSPLPAFVEVIVAPPGEPRTKPRALNIALELARGAFTTIYEAENVPHPGQLRLAVATFAASGPEVACCQARLAIDNTEDGWLTRFFTVEYAALFDVINPGLAALDLPIPLGGTSNHFRTEILRSAGAWDAWNVTEDADLGIRLALMGYRVVDLPSTTTIEEAPARLDAWMSQLARWMKGFMQVCITHSRRPIRAARQLGPLAALAAVTMTFGTVATALGYPVWTALAIWNVLSCSLWEGGSLPRHLASAVGLVVLPAGLAAMLAPPAVALRRRGWTKLMPLVPLLPFYYVLVSVAVWRGAVELLVAPFRWNKTDYGLAVTSRSGALRTGQATPRPPP